MNPRINEELFGKYQKLRDIIGEMKSVIIAMSGGVDSVLLAKTASDTLHDHALIVTVDSPLLPRRELRDAVDLAERLGLRHLVIHIEILSNSNFSSNPSKPLLYM